jgi:hypothetical protein
MMSEWMKVMLEEIARKKAETVEARIEEQRRLDDQKRRDERGRREDAIVPPRSGTDRARG